MMNFVGVALTGNYEPVGRRELPGLAYLKLTGRL